MADSPRSPGRPRDGDIDERVLEATRQLIAEVGYGSLTITEVARRAGVSRPSVYRRWPNRGALVFDAIFQRTETGSVPNTGNVVDDLKSLASVFAQDLTSPVAAAALAGVMADFGADAGLAARIRDGIMRPRARQLAEVLDRAAERGEIRDDIDRQFVIETIAGGLYFRSAILAEPLDVKAIDRLISLVAQGLFPAAAGERNGPERGSHKQPPPGKGSRHEPSRTT